MVAVLTGEGLVAETVVGSDDTSPAVTKDQGLALVQDRITLTVEIWRHVNLTAGMGDAPEIGVSLLTFEYLPTGKVVFHC